jgi:hypothetical protein
VTGSAACVICERGKYSSVPSWRIMMNSLCVGGGTGL